MQVRYQAALHPETFHDGCRFKEARILAQLRERIKPRRDDFFLDRCTDAAEDALAARFVRLIVSFGFNFLVNSGFVV